LCLSNKYPTEFSLKNLSKENSGRKGGYIIKKSRINLVEDGEMGLTSVYKGWILHLRHRKFGEYEMEKIYWFMRLYEKTVI
jgi:hypothetical protein